LTITKSFYPAGRKRRRPVLAQVHGVGIGTNADQRRLLRLIRERWLADGSRVVIDVANPLVWAGWAGDISHRDARPEDGTGRRPPN
jgi:hypothetical protein